MDEALFRLLRRTTGSKLGSVAQLAGQHKSEFALRSGLLQTSQRHPDLRDFVLFGIESSQSGLQHGVLLVHLALTVPLILGDRSEGLGVAAVEMEFYRLGFLVEHLGQTLVDVGDILQSFCHLRVQVVAWCGEKAACVGES